MIAREGVRGASGRRLRVVIAPDSFKGTAPASEVAAALADGWRTAHPDDDVIELPMADGGEGTLDAVRRGSPSALPMPVRVTGPTGSPVDAEWLLIPDPEGRTGGTGIVELARTCGIELVGDGGLRALEAHTRGFGEAIRAALGHGVHRLVLTVGGSASSDGGSGALLALGAVLRTHGGGAPVLGARGLADIVAADLTAAVPPPPGGAVILMDVTAPLIGPRGAAAVFAPQKGATPAQVSAIEAALQNWARVVGHDPWLPGAGAAGGTGYGLAAWGARPVHGAEAVGELLGLGAAIAAADVVVTGEGAYDEQSHEDKVPAHVLALAEATDAWCALVAGQMRTPSTRFAASAALTDLAPSVRDAMIRPGHWLHLIGAGLADAAHAR